MMPFRGGSIISDNLFIYEKTRAHLGVITTVMVRWVQNPCFIQDLVTLITYRVPGWGYCCQKHRVPDHMGLRPSFSFMALCAATKWFKFGSCFSSRPFFTLRCKSALMSFGPWYSSLKKIYYFILSIAPPLDLVHQCSSSGVENT